MKPQDVASSRECVDGHAKFKPILKTNINVLFKRKYTHPTLICRGTDGRTDGRTDARTDGRTENIYSIFRGAAAASTPLVTAAMIGDDRGGGGQQ